jgi:hypothetical protein
VEVDAMMKLLEAGVWPSLVTDGSVERMLIQSLPPISCVPHCGAVTKILHNSASLNDRLKIRTLFRQAFPNIHSINEIPCWSDPNRTSVAAQ